MENKSLAEKIAAFSNEKKRLIPFLLVLGIGGLFLPVLPGVAILFLAFWLLFPSQGEKIANKMRDMFNNLRRKRT